MSGRSCSHCGRYAVTERPTRVVSPVDPTCCETARSVRDTASGRGERVCQYCGKPLPVTARRDAMYCPHPGDSPQHRLKSPCRCAANYQRRAKGG